MAQQQTEFTYHNIELYKSQRLGSGSYGGVCKAKCDGLLCAAKIMHPTLFDMRDPGTPTYLRKFREECHLLSLARHPNVVQYLGTYTDPDTRLPVLLMELCDESLTSFLERSPGPLSYHTQVNICHDIALALVYLHSNGIIHRDLTGNNVLMVNGFRAKITDFGMSKLAKVNARMTALTTCPGNALYMSPEALDEQTYYTAKLDIFSYGVIVIQILTRKFPSPMNRFRFIRVPPFQEPLRQAIPETERREAHLKLIPNTHLLKPLALQCLKKENERPSALRLSESLSDLKWSSQYRDSMLKAKSSNTNQELQTVKPTEEQAQLATLHSIVDVKEQQLQAKDRQLLEQQQAIATRDHALEIKQRELQQGEQLIKEFQQSLQQKDKTITDLRQTISTQKRKIQELEQQGTASKNQPKLQPVTIPETTVVKDIKLREGRNAPVAMARGAVVVHGKTAYFKSRDSFRVYSYQNILGKEQWCQLPDNPNGSFVLVVIDSLVTSVGGDNFIGPINTLFSLIGEGGKKRWSEVFPPMPTPRSEVACVTTQEAVIVAGGHASAGFLSTVEYMNTDIKQWTTACPLPQKMSSLSAITCGDKLYLAGGLRDRPSPSMSAFACSLSELLTSSNSLKYKIQRKIAPTLKVWNEISDLPVTWSTLVSFHGHVLAIGGRDDSDSPTSDVYEYDVHTDSWTVASQMKNKRSHSLAVTLPDNQLLIVGGRTCRIGFYYTNTASVEHVP